MNEEEYKPDPQIDAVNESPTKSNSPEMDMELIYEWDLKEDSIQNIISKLRPLDLILFSGNSLVSKTIKFAEKEKLGLGTISHVGMIVTKEILPHIKELKKDKFYIWESTSKKQGLFRKNVKDVYGKNRYGVQIRELEEVVKNYLLFQGRVFWGKLNDNPWKILNKDLRHSQTNNSINNLDKICEDKDEVDKECFICVLKELEKTYGKSSFNLNLIDLAASLYPSFRPLRKLKKKIMNYLAKNSKRKKYTPLFCSEFVAIIYKSLKILDENIQPSDVVPVDFLGINEFGIPRLIKKVIEFK